MINKEHEIFGRYNMGNNFKIEVTNSCKLDEVPVSIVTNLQRNKFIFLHYMFITFDPPPPRPTPSPKKLAVFLLPTH